MIDRRAGGTPPPIQSQGSTHEYKVRGAQTRFFGRKHELEVLYNALREAATTSSLRLVTLVGASGTGKRRLVDEMLALVDVARRGITVYATDSLADEPEESLRFSDQILRQRFQLAGGGPEALHAQLDKGLAGMVSEAKRPDAVKLLSHLLSLPVARDSARPAGPTLHERAIQTFLNLLRYDAGSRPHIVVLEGFEHAPGATRELLGRLVAVLRAAPVLVVLIAREAVDLPEGLSAVPRTGLELTPLGQPVMQQIAQHLLKDVRECPPWLVARTVEKADGNPALLEDLVRLMYQRDILTVVGEGDGQSVVFHPDRLEKAQLPGTSAGAARARLDNLGVREQLVVEMASIFGRVFWFSGVLSLLRLDRRPEDDEERSYWVKDKQEARLNATLLEMQGLDLVEFRTDAGIDGEVAFAFVRAADRERIYAQLEPERRALYHRMAGQWLSRVSPNQAFQVSELMGWHYEQGGRPHHAAEGYAAAARLAVEACQNRRAIGLYGRALKLYDPADAAAQCVLYAELADLLLGTGDVPSAEKAAAELLYYSSLTGDKARGGMAWLRFGRIAVLEGHYDEGFTRLRRARSLFAAVEDLRGLADCQEEIGHLHRVKGEYGSSKSALSCFVKSLGFRRQIGDWNAVAGSLVQIGHVHLGRGDLARAVESYEEALSIRREKNDRWGIARVLNGLGAAHHEAGRSDEAVAAWTEGITLASAAGDRQLTGMLQNNLAEARLQREEIDVAGQLLESAYEAATEIGNRRLQAEVLRNQAEVSRVRGRYGTALQQVEQSLALGEAIAARRSVGTSLRTRGNILAEMLRRGPGPNTAGLPLEDASTGAEASFKQSVAYFEEMGDQLEQALSMRAYGGYLLDLGDTARAKRLLARAEAILNPSDQSAETADE